LKRKRGKILEIARKYGATSIRVFGSVARNEDDERSDVDFRWSWSQDERYLIWAGF